jgi:secretion/DNA translocation related CpaE-like protein
MTTAPPALLITRDDRLLDDLLRLAAAAGSTLDVAHDPVSGLRAWRAASVVLLGADLAAPVARQHPPRRDHVHLVGLAPLPDGVFRSALAAGAVDVVELPVAEAWLIELLTDASDAADGRAAGGGRHGRTLGVVAGSGGAGATTFACAVARTSARQQRTVLVDLDPLGPGVDRVVGLDATSGTRWDTLTSSRGRLGSRSLRAALPDKDGLAVLTWGTGSPTGPRGAVRSPARQRRRGGGPPPLPRRRHRRGGHPVRPGARGHPAVHPRDRGCWSGGGPRAAAQRPCGSRGAQWPC